MRPMTVSAYGWDREAIDVIHSLYRRQDLAVYTRHPDFWLEDGNIVLVANRSVAFRVHRSVVARKSGVFHDMFSFPQPGASCKPSCPVLHLPDSPEDLSYFFDAIYNGMR